MNILLLVADDLGRDLGCLGNRAIRTPNLEALAAEGTLFTNAFASTASCSGSRSTLYTGRHTHQNGQYGLNHDCHHFETFAGTPTLPALFNAAGWRTGIIGKVHVGPRATYPWQVQDGAVDSRNVREMADHFASFLSTDRSTPFCAILGYTDPHRHNDASGFANRDYPGVERRVYDPAAVVVPPFLPDLPEVRAELAQYYEAVDRLDQGVGMALEALRRDGRLDDTLVAFVSDNGCPFVNSKTTLFDAGVHLPLIVRMPGSARGIRNPNLVSFVDVLPTFLEVAGIAAPAGLAGRSFRSVLEHGDAAPGWDRVFCSHTFHQVTNYWPTRVLRTRRWKYHRNVAWQLDFPFASDLYESKTWQAIARRGGAIGQREIERYVRRPAEELYDLETDPHEVRDRAADPTCATILAEMRTELERWQVATDDPWIYRDGVSALDRLKRGAVVPGHWDLRWAGMAAARG